MRETEEEIIYRSEKYFKEKSKKFNEILSGHKIRSVILNLEKEYEKESKNKKVEWRITDRVNSEEYLKNMIKKLPLNKTPIIIAGGSFNSRGMKTNIEEDGINILKKLVKHIDPNRAYFVIGHSIRAYEEELIKICKKYNKTIEIYAIIPNSISKEVKERIINSDISGVAISIESEESGIYKSFNYELFERIKTIVIAFDGNSPVSNLVQEAKNGKGKSKIYVNSDNENLAEKANNLEGYVVPFELVHNNNIINKIMDDTPNIWI